MNQYNLILALLSILLFSVSCTSVLTNEEIEDLDLKAIETYISQNQLEGDFIGDDIFVSILDTGVLSLLADSVIQIDTVFADTFYVDTTFIDSTFTLDTVLMDTQLINRLVPDTTFFYDNPSSLDTVLVSFVIADLTNRLIFSTEGNSYQREWGAYPALNQLMPGLQSALQEFSAGGRGIALIPSSEAYGRVGNGADLTGNTPVRIDFDLIGYYK